MKKLISSISLLALSCAAVAANAQDPECNGNGTWIGADSRGLWCELPADIATGGVYELARTSSGSQTSGAPILWVLPQVVVVGNGHLPGATPSTVDDTEIVIDAGAKIAGAIENSALVITRGARLTANGTASDPIVFSSMDADYSGQGEWGGVIISGFGEANECPGDSSGCLMEGIANDDFYFGGGADTTHSSGSLSYVVITEGGSVVDLETDGDPDPNSNSGDEINGLTLYAINDTTNLNNIHVHDNLDDGIEFFGGDVDVTNLWLTCHQDDSLDWDFGYTGNVTNLQIVQQDGADHAFELANNPDNFNALPRSSGSVINASLTLAGNGSVSDMPFMLKEGTDGHFDNIVIQGYSSVAACADATTANNPTFGSLVEYDCNDVNSVLPPSNPAASGFTQATFWADYPGCN